MRRTVFFIILCAWICCIGGLRLDSLKQGWNTWKKVLCTSLLSTVFQIHEARASMLTFPLPSPFKNNIVLVRSGESFADARNEIQTNPAKKLRQDNALTMQGREQAIEVARILTNMDFSPTYIWTSNTERAYETASIIARECQIGQNRIVPEYSFLDARAVGFYEGKNSISAWEEIHANDKKIGINYKPPPTNDGTPTESVKDVLVRANQVVSTIESMYSGENVVIVSPDSEVFSILTAALYDEQPDDILPYHAQFAFRNGEARVLKPFVKVSTLLVTGQTPEEADLNLRKMRAMRIVGMSRNVETNAKPFSWFDLWKSTVDFALENN